MTLILLPLQRLLPSPLLLLTQCHTQTAALEVFRLIRFRETFS
jgi:hypothetical protein